MFTNFIIWLNEHGIEASDDTIISERLNFLKESESKNYYDKIIDFETETKMKLPNDYKIFCKNKTYNQVLKKLKDKEFVVKNFDNIIVTIEYISDFEKSKQDDGGYKFDVVDWRGLPKGAIIFCQDIGGNAITFYKNAVWYVDHDPYRKTKVCDSFTDFLKMLK